MIQIKVDLFNEDCIDVMQRKIIANTVDLIVTSPLYYNARDCTRSQNVQTYIEFLNDYFRYSHQVLKNYHFMVFNVADIVTKTSKSNSSKTKLPLVAIATILAIENDFKYIDNIIWDKGEVQSKANFVGKPYPLQKYPISCHESLLIFQKINNDIQHPTCPQCHQNHTTVNGIVNGVQTFECRNPQCKKSKSGRGVRFSELQKERKTREKPENRISDDFIKHFRRNIVQFPPVIKINHYDNNTVNRFIPFPRIIPEYAIAFYTGKGDTVFDPFLGSGTTGVVAIEKQRNFIGCELNKERYKDAKKRILKSKKKDDNDDKKID